jgi:DNA mismatch endonuclease, patch repair protein
MADIVNAATRSRMMAGIRGKNTKPELLVRRYLHARGLRYRLHIKNLPGKPDLVLPKYKVVVFVHGCFWHQHSDCKYATMAALEGLAWRVLVVWECQLREGLGCLEKLYSEIIREEK